MGEEDCLRGWGQGANSDLLDCVMYRMARGFFQPGSSVLPFSLPPMPCSATFLDLKKEVWKELAAKEGTEYIEACIRIFEGPSCYYFLKKEGKLRKSLT